mgnify:CR=1 FL=1
MAKMIINEHGSVCCTDFLYVNQFVYDVFICADYGEVVRTWCAWFFYFKKIWFALWTILSSICTGLTKAYGSINMQCFILM